MANMELYDIRSDGLVAAQYRQWAIKPIRGVNLKDAVRIKTDPTEALGIVAICFGWPIFGSIYSIMNGFKNGTFSDGRMIATIAMELFLGAIAIYFLYVRKYAISTLYPTPSVKGAGIGVVLYVATVIAYWVFVVPLYSGQPTQPIQQMVSSATVSLSTVVPMAIINGAYEEIFLLGFLLRGLRGYGVSTAIGISLLVRLLYHLYQGPIGAISILALGMIFSVYYVRTERLFPVVFAHIIADIIPFL